MGVLKATSNAVTKTTKGFFRTFLNVPAWLSLPVVKTQATSVFALIKSIFMRRQAKHGETFDQAMVRLNLTEEDIKQRYAQTRYQFWIYLLLMFGLLTYTIYLLISGSLMACILSGLITLLCLVKTASMHFWMYQIRHRKLGCSIREWLISFAGGSK